MLIPIPYGQTYTTTVSGRANKFVQCEQCGYEYVYGMVATVAGHSTSLLFLDNTGAADRSRSQAEMSVGMPLEAGCARVPCPTCGRVQKDMVTEARRWRYLWMTRTKLPAFVIGAFLFMLARSGTQYPSVFWVGVGAAVCAPIVFPILRRMLARW